MKWRTGFLLQLCISALTVFAHAGATAALVVYDGFRLSIPVYGVSGTGFAGPWVNVGPVFEVGDPSLCHPGLRTTGLSLSSGAGDGYLARAFATPFGAPGTTRYVSFLLQPQSDAAAGYSGLFLDGTLGSLFVGKPGGGATGHYVAETNGGAGQVATNVPVVQGTTVLLVLKIQFNAANDIITLYANPAPGAAEPSSGSVKVDLDFGSLTGFSFGSVGAPFSFDELRVGTTYADVVPVEDRQKCK